ncbi:MAG: ATP-binding protein [Patescibacteria group bacterium]
MASSNKKLVRGHLGASSFRKMGLGVGCMPYNLVGQMIVNALDARARNITITIDTHGAFLQCEDDGAGMREEVWSEFIGMADSSKEGDETTIGENGTGHTTYWLAYDHVDLWTAWADDPYCHHLSYSHDEAWAFSQKNGEGGIEPTTVLKSSSSARVKATGTVIRLTSPWKNDSAIRVLPGEVQRTIARVLSPWHLGMVTINGEKPRIDFPKGEFYRALDEIPGVGQIEIIAGFADDQVRDQDRSWGTWGAHVCSHSELMDALPGRLNEVFAPELLHPNVWFMVRVHSWKHFEGKHTRRFFKPSLFKDKSFEEVVRHLHKVLLHEIRKRARIDTGTDGVGDEVIDRVVTRLVETVGQRATRGPAPGPTPTHKLAFKPARVKLVCGSNFVFGVMNADQDGNYQLDASASGGSILVDGKWLTGKNAVVNLTRPSQITYQAGKLLGHRYKMHLKHVADNGEIAASAVCEIRLEEHLAFTISPMELILEPGETGRVSVVNDEGKDGFTWATTEKGRIAPETDGRSANVTAPMELGNYTITATASDGTCAQGRLSVRMVQSHTSESGGSIVLMKTVIVEGVTFVVMSLPTEEQSQQRARLSLCMLAGESKYQIWFNFLAPEAEAGRRAKSGSLYTLVSHEVVMRIAAALVEREARKAGRLNPVQMSDVIARRDSLMSKIYT